VSALPTLFVVDPDGVVRRHHTGISPGTEEELAREIEELL
jgi:hypothetical protein